MKTPLPDLERLLQSCLAASASADEAAAATQHECQQALVQHALTHPELYQAFWDGVDPLAETIAARSHLLRKIYPDLNQFCQKTLGWSCSPLTLTWRFWLPLAQWIDGQQRRAGRPFVQGVLGAQGTGKTTLTLILSRILAQLGHRACCLSIDDFYKPYPERLQLQAADPRLRWRGPPGTHDVDLALGALQQLKAGQAARVPRFDKAAHQGQGDRAGFETVSGATVVLFEGWFVGVRPIPPERFNAAPWPIETEGDRDFARDSNERLRVYLPLWEQLDRLLVLHPVDYRLSARWRREAEQAMTAAGRSGMSDAEIERFVVYFWQALHPELFITPLLRDGRRVDWVVEIGAQHDPQRIYQPIHKPH